MAFILSGFVGGLIALLKHLHGMGWGTAQIAKWFTTIGWVPGIPFLWQHASLNGSGHPNAAWSLYSLICFGLMLVGVVFCALVRPLNRDIRRSNQEARVERLGAVAK